MEQKYRNYVIIALVIVLMAGIIANGIYTNIQNKRMVANLVSYVNTIKIATQHPSGTFAAINYGSVNEDYLVCGDSLGPMCNGECKNDLKCVWDNEESECYCEGAIYPGSNYEGVLNEPVDVADSLQTPMEQTPTQSLDMPVAQMININAGILCSSSSNGKCSSEGTACMGGRTCQTKKSTINGEDVCLCLDPKIGDADLGLDNILQ